jgi:hypothetical protein
MKQWVLQALDTLGMEPLLAAITLDHFDQPVSIFAAIAVYLLNVCSMVNIPL